MAIFNEILVGRFNKALQRAFAIKASAPVRQLGGEIMPVYPMFRGVEERYLESWGIFFGAVTVAAVAAVTGAVRLRNPTGSNVIAVVEQWNFFSTVGADQPLLETDITNTDLANVGRGNTGGDSRQTSLSALITSNGTTGAGAAQLLVRAVNGANITTDFISTLDQELVLLPGRSLQLRSQIVNTSVVESLRWRERALEESERI